MDPEQIDHLLRSIDKLATALSQSQPYTITGASDWPILLVIGGMLVAMIGFMWNDLRSTLKDDRSEWQKAVEAHKKENVKSFDDIWEEHRRCQDKCCK